MQSISSSPCILFQIPSASITIIDIPRSLELSQSQGTKRLLSVEPLQNPFPSHDPKTPKARAKVGKHDIEDLIVQKHLELSLAEIKQTYEGEWCLPRVVEQTKNEKIGSVDDTKRQRLRLPSNQDMGGEELDAGNSFDQSNPQHLFASPFVQNHFNMTVPVIHNSDTHATIPPRSTYLKGDISTTISTFNQHAPLFNLIILDPPWPNRSARRKAGYEISYNTTSIRSLLFSIPLEDHIAEDGYVGVWITNKPIFRKLTLEVFAEWGVEFVEEWIWLKVTAKGEPVCALDGLWKKPYEILLVARKGGVRDDSVERKVVVGVPDLHSRKPSLKCLFEVLMQKRTGEYEGLEIFARNLTEGWWGWGNEVLKFQEDEHWTDSMEDVSPSLDSCEQIDT